MQQMDFRQVPKNIRQMGDREDLDKVYIEDYVNTYIRKAERNGALAVGALCGGWSKTEQGEFLFISGAIMAEHYRVEQDRIILTDESYSSLYGCLAKFFPDLGVCGWFICSPDGQLCEVNTLYGSLDASFQERSLLFCLRDSDREEESMVLVRPETRKRLKGYYIFYERNEPMQEYMVATNPIQRSEPVTADRAASSFRTRMAERKTAAEGNVKIPEKGRKKAGKIGTVRMKAEKIHPETPQTEEGSSPDTRPAEGTFSLRNAASLVAGICILAAGITMFGRYEEMKKAEAVLTNLSGIGMTGQTEDTAASESDTLPDKEKPVINLIPAGIDPTEQPTEEQSSEAQGEPETNALPEEETDEAPETEMAGTDGRPDAENVSSGYTEYIVQNGDTLVTICRAIYGRTDDELLDKVCQLNGMEDRDFIFVGQKLKLP